MRAWSSALRFASVSSSTLRETSLIIERREPGSAARLEGKLVGSESEGVIKISFCVPSVRRLCLRILGAAGGGGVDAEDVSEVLD